MKYLRKFDNHTDYESEEDNLIRPNVSYCVQENEVHYNPIDYSIQYLTFVALEDGTFKLSGNAVQYSLDDGANWTELAANTNSPTVTTGSKILWKGEFTPSSYYPYGIGTFSSTGQFNVEGNPMSLLFGDNFRGQTDLTGKNYAFYYLFLNCTKLVSSENLSLPATTLAQYCYQNMFDYCTRLTKVPELPATTLANNCYVAMFQYCSSLTTAPELPATTLARYCYQNMFNHCTSLTKVPELPATTLDDYCYNDMFHGCTSLNYIKCLATDISATQCTTNWVDGVAVSGTFVKDASMTSWTTGNNGIPSGWSVEDA